jgi:hypothetical protein
VIASAVSSSSSEITSFTPHSPRVRRSRARPRFISIAAMTVAEGNSHRIELSSGASSISEP